MKQKGLFLEWLILFVAIPVVLWFDVLPVRPLWLLPIPLLYCLAVYKYKGMVEPEPAPREAYRNMLLRIGGAALCIALWVYAAFPERFLEIPRQYPTLWVLILLLYPLISALPQEFIYRHFYFQRYDGLFQSHNRLVWSSALTFSWLHVFYHNWIALALTALAGMVFAQSYQRTRSLKLVWLEHTLYGQLIFTLGLGRFFFHG